MRVINVCATLLALVCTPVCSAQSCAGNGGYQFYVPAYYGTPSYYPPAWSLSSAWGGYSGWQQGAQAAYYGSPYAPQYNGYNGHWQHSPQFNGHPFHAPQRFNLQLGIGRTFSDG
jgi:hypothetical protein